MRRMGDGRKHIAYGIDGKFLSYVNYMIKGNLLPCIRFLQHRQSGQSDKFFYIGDNVV